MIRISTHDWLIDDIKLVIFDKDGTFIDIHKYWGRVVELRAEKTIRYFSLNKTFFEPLCSVMGYDLSTKKLPPDSPVGLYARGNVQEILLYYLVAQGVDAYLEDIERIFAEVNEEFLKEQEDYTVTIPEALEFMENLNNKVSIAVITSDSRENAKKTINDNFLEKYFVEVFGAEDSETAKTTGEIVRKMLNKLEVKPENVICIGDTFDDYLMAKNSGIKACINESTGVVTKTQHLEYNKYTVETLDELYVE